MFDSQPGIRFAESNTCCASLEVWLSTISRPWSKKRKSQYPGRSPVKDGIEVSMGPAKPLFEPADTEELLRGWLLHAHKSRDRHDEAARR